MKKFALSLAAAGALVLGSAGVADASTYEPDTPAVTQSATEVEGGAEVNIFITCAPSESVTVIFQGVTINLICLAVAGGNDAAVATGTATATVTAPTEPGTYTGTVTGSVSGDLGTFTIVVAGQTTPAPTPGGQLPATGSDGTSTMTLAAGGRVVTGLGRFAGASGRRRQDAGA